ncbi:pyruvate, phosphate dikinase [Longimicrobium terrae]|uniref:Pyruvate, phosphate dikinase n=1 Tax=Longimicrobium terrae TaxID=1639882 RepID=A0A841H6V5_9BACT|nr:pyruvate, phosphate dikinase [Longimicrobium terrae]MBB4639488.1 pyruvate,orthophosphate dikinase [Longimicrobium terrae]MBB6073860.1 pyruvate,orthophosphate dikinase [Longimicrobium terrae]NNC32536.1 pyruvate, phosphate dikinase [Longimicrobium terrae]
MADRYVYFFGAGETEGSRDMKDLLGGKGAGLAEMARIGVPVPPGFTITTEVCRLYLHGGRYPDGLREQVDAALARLERATDKRFGGGEAPLLVSVRSGAAFSMPGMMDTILNLGLNDRTAEALAAASGDARFAFDSYRRFVQMYADVVMGVHADQFERLLEDAKHRRGVTLDTELSADDLRALVAEFKALVRTRSGKDFPEDPQDQLWGAIAAVFGSWDTPRAKAYRRINNISDSLGTAVSVCSMVFGNMGDDSGTGVAFTRDPSTGEPRLYGEFLVNAQGEDVVAGIRDPLHIDGMEQALPASFHELVAAARLLEDHYRDAQDLEFTVEKGRLYLLQTRNAKRTGRAAVRMAVEMVDEGRITPEEAVLRVAPEQLDQLLHPMIDPSAPVRVLSTALPASPGAASGRVVFNPDEAAERGPHEPVILVRRETSPEDFHGMVVSQGILTCRGGMTSHAAVVARGMGKCCVAGAGDIVMDEARRTFSAAGETVREGDWITLDGSTGRVILGKVPTVEPEPTPDFERLMAWADGFRRLRVRTNADTPHDSVVARRFGAEGIGLCRTEHMFFEGDRIDAVREMILADSGAQRAIALAKLLPMQRADFEGIFRAMDGLPVTIRLLDPPLHEFLPHGPAEIRDLARKLGQDPIRLREQVERHHEANPMLGHRGCRLGISFPDITWMQAQAIFEAAVNVQAEGITVFPEIMIPLVATAEELARQRKVVDDVAHEVFFQCDAKVDYLVGTMIELPRAALTADRIAEHAQFFSFGTNDLTQTTFGLSRDDAGRFLPEYVGSGILPDDPFQTLDIDGVGRLVETASRLGRGVVADLKLGVCGEHGGDPRSVTFFHQVGLDYVSCSPYRVPVARLAAAHAALADRKRTTGPATPLEAEALAAD